MSGDVRLSISVRSRAGIRINTAAGRTHPPVRPGRRWVRSPVAVIPPKLVEHEVWPTSGNCYLPLQITTGGSRHGCRAAVGTWDGAACRLRVLRTGVGHVEGVVLPDVPGARLPARRGGRGARPVPARVGRAVRAGPGPPPPALRPHDAVLRDGEVRRHRLRARGRGHPHEDSLAGDRHRPGHRAPVRRQRPRLAAVDPPHRMALDPLHLRGVRARESSPRTRRSSTGRSAPARRSSRPSTPPTCRAPARASAPTSRPTVRG